MKSFFMVWLFLPLMALGQPIAGTWKTVDDDTGAIRSVVKIEEKDGEFYGKVVEVFDQTNPDPRCVKCSGKLKNQKIIGMTIITNVKYDPDDEVYQGGKILDPESGNVYNCELWVEEEKLKVRGYMMFLYRTQTWLPYK